MSRPASSYRSARRNAAREASLMLRGVGAGGLYGVPPVKAKVLDFRARRAQQEATAWARVCAAMRAIRQRKGVGRPPMKA